MSKQQSAKGKARCSNCGKRMLPKQLSAHKASNRCRKPE